MTDRADPATLAHARSLDASGPLRHLRSEFIIPSKTDLRRSTLDAPPNEPPSLPSIYLCGNSLGLQPVRASTYISTFLRQWSTKAVTGHFVEHSDSPLAPFLHIDDRAASLLAPLIGATAPEVAVMGTLTANLHFAMASFYRPDPKRHKILFEGKAFPSDHYAIESQIAHHGFDPKKSMIVLDPPSGSATLSTDQICQTITENKDELALVLLPGVQFYTGQLLDIASITAHARTHSITIGWDLAHAVGNVELKLHEWDVDFAVWCSYKYLNCGPGAMGGLFVHERHGRVDMERPEEERYRPRLSGWWGADKETRFLMNNEFIPRPGASGFQLSNPSALDLSAVVASLEIFSEATMPAIRAKSIAMTKYLGDLLEALRTGTDFETPPFEVITPLVPEQRGAQLSIRLAPELLTSVLEHLEQNGVVVDERKPDVIRVAPAPLYNTYEDVWQFCRIFSVALKNGSEQPQDLEKSGGISKSGS